MLYHIKSSAQGKVGPNLKWRKAWKDLRQRVAKRGKTVRIRSLADENFGPELRTFSGTLRLMRKIRADKVGAVWVALAQDDTAFFVRKIDPAPPLINTDGNDRVDKYYSAVMARYRNVQNWGMCVCKRILGTTSWSQHSYCNAWDANADHETMYEMSRWAATNADEYSIHTVIFDHQSWSRETPYWHPYGGVDPHETHVHTDFDPQGIGYPSSC